MIKSNRYRSDTVAGSVIAFSISYQRDNMLARGLGLEHLRELLIRLARPLLRQGASLAYGGNWQETEDNFTHELLRLISAEQEDNSLGGPDTSLRIGRLYNHLAWPHYLSVTPSTEARWVSCCRIVRISQELAGIPEHDRVPDDEASVQSDRGRFNAAITLSAMRRLMMTDMSLEIPDAPNELIPAVVARVMLGGKTCNYSGFGPGLFEEALLTLEHRRPLYVLGGFGGAAEVLARALLSDSRPPELTLEWQKANTPSLSELATEAGKSALPFGVRSPAALLDDLHAAIVEARKDLPGALATGLGEAETRELLLTSDTSRVVKLVRDGLGARSNLPHLPA